MQPQVSTWSWTISFMFYQLLPFFFQLDETLLYGESKWKDSCTKVSGKYIFYRAIDDFHGAKVRAVSNSDRMTYHVHQLVDKWNLAAMHFLARKWTF
jgi:hypothetical protein